MPDAVNLPLITAKERGAGGGHIRFNMAKGSMNSHISQFPIGTYKKAHAHGPGAHVIMLCGDGYSLMWPEGDEPQRYDWEIGTHDRAARTCGSTSTSIPARRRRAISPSSTRSSSIRNAQGVPKAWISRRIGGDQIDYADEKPEIRQHVHDELANHGVAPKMDGAYAKEMEQLGLKTA